MAKKREYISWFLDEIPILKDKGIIQDDTASALTEHYRSNLAALPTPRNIFSLVIGILGVVITVAGAILFLNYNWDMFPKSVRIALASIPLLLGAITAYLTISKDKTQVWREGSAIMTSAGAMTLIAVLSQIYHTGGELYEFMFLISLLSLPLIYIFNSIGLATLYIFFSFFVIERTIPWWNAFLIVLILPYLFYHLRKNSSFGEWSYLLAILAAISLFFGSSVEVYGAFTIILICSIFIVNGVELMQSNVSSRKNLWLIPPFAMQVVVLAIGSSTEELFSCRWHKDAAELWTFAIINGVLFLGYMLLFFRKRITFEKVAGVLLIMLTAIPMLCDDMECREWIKIGFNIYMAAYGIALIRNGIKSRTLLLFNGGTVTVGVLTACRFFDSDIGLLARSLGLMVLGIGFLLANRFFIKFSKGKETEQ